MAWQIGYGSAEMATVVACSAWIAPQLGVRLRGLLQDSVPGVPWIVIRMPAGYAYAPDLRFVFPDMAAIMRADRARADTNREI
jgi:hypothetical protein